MKNVLHRLRPASLTISIASLLLGIFCTGGNALAAATPIAPMTTAEARQAMTETFSHLSIHESVRNVKYTRRKVTFSANNKIDHGRPIDVSVTFANLKTLSVKTGMGYRLVEANGEPLFYFERKSDAQTFVDAALVLRAAAVGPDPEVTDFRVFAAQAEIWRATVPRPEMPDAARTDKVVAQEAVERKDFAAALAAYCSALEKFPMWPEGQYNAAMLAAEARDYELAAYHMRRYCALAPDAGDASKAKDKLLLWQHKVAVDLPTANKGKAPKGPPGSRMNN